MEALNVTHFFFDIGGVLIQYDQERFIDELAEKYQVARRRLEPFFTVTMLKKVETGHISSGDFFHSYLQPVIKISYEEWIECFVHHYELNEPGMLLLKKLQQKGYATYLLSNQAEYNAIAIQKKFQHFYHLCKKNFLSYEMGLFKPDPAIYLEACKKAGIAPFEACFFDDKEENVQGAIAAGMKGIVYTNQISNELLSTIDQIK